MINGGVEGPGEEVEKLFILFDRIQSDFSRNTIICVIKFLLLTAAKGSFLRIQIFRSVVRCTSSRVHKIYSLVCLISFGQCWLGGSASFRGLNLI